VGVLSCPVAATALTTTTPHRPAALPVPTRPDPAAADLLTTANTSRPAADAGRAGRHHDTTTPTPQKKD
jgi:hypothetical protein